MHTLYLAEKPTAGKTIAQYLSKKLGKPITPMKDHILIGNDVVVGWLQGHLVENVAADAYDPIFQGDWAKSAHLLPFIPNPFKLEVKPRTRALFQTTKGLALKAGEIVNCADPDDQGELLSMQFLSFIGYKKPVRRLLAADLSDKGLDRAFANIKSSSDLIGSYHSALAQSHADWLYGINMTRACTLQAKKKGSRLLLNVGRVKTPTWGMIVRRELAIRNFKPQDYYLPWLDATAKPVFRARWSPEKDDDRLDAEGRLLDASVAAGIEKAVRGARQAVVSKADTKPGNEAAPMPFSLSSLQALASRVYGLSPKQTLEVAQALYDKKLVSYPRTPLEYIPETQHGDAPAILGSLSKAPLPTTFANALRGSKPGLKSVAFDTKKVDGASHHAIIPTELANPGDISALSDIEKKIYLEIVRRYVLQFWPAAKVMLTEIELECAGEPFAVKGKRYVDEGWRKAFSVADQDEDDGKSVDAEQALPDVRVGMVLPVADCGVDSKTTTAPQRFTEGTLLTAMKRAHLEIKDPKIRERLKEKEGLGTEATRANIIQETVDSDLFTMGGKGNKEIIPTEDAIRFISVLPETMTQPDLTAMWQLYFDGIKKGGNTYADFINQQSTWLKKMVASVESFFEHVKFDSLPASAGGKGRSEIQVTEHPCTACGSPLKHINGKFGWFFACSSDECKKLFTDLNGKPVEKAARAPEQHSGVDCPQCKKGFLRLVPRRDGSGSFWGCSGYTAGCKAAYNDDEGKPDLEGRTRKPGAGPATKDSGIGCPQCGAGSLRLIPRGDKSGSFWGCSAYRDNGCRAAYNDDGGKPDIEGKTRGTGGGQRRTAAPPAASGVRSSDSGQSRPASRPPAGGGSRGAPPSFAERARRHGGSVAYDPLGDI